MAQYLYIWVTLVKLGKVKMLSLKDKLIYRYFNDINVILLSAISLI